MQKTWLFDEAVDGSVWIVDRFFVCAANNHVAELFESRCPQGVGFLSFWV
jgi:hypothetical protein